MLTLRTLNFLQQILVTCSTTCSNEKFLDIYLNNNSNVISEKPWNLLNILPKTPGNCVNFVFDSYSDYQKTMTIVDQSRKELKIVLLNSNISEAKREIEKWSPSCEIHLVQLINNTVQGHYYHTPIGSDGRAVNRHVTVSHSTTRPYIIKQKPFPEGSDVDIMKELSDKLNFSVMFTPVKSFNQLVKLIADQKADMSVSHAAGDLHRYRLGLDFFAMYYRKYVLVYRHPRSIHPIYTISLPFTLEVWGAMLISIVGIMLTLALLNRWYGSKKWLCLSDMSLSYVPLIRASVPDQWYSKHIKQPPNYVILFFWLLMGTVLSMSYSSNLLAHLVKVEPEFHPQTLQEVLDMQVGVYILKNSILREFLEESPQEIQRRIFLEAVMNRGGYYSGSVLPPPDIIEKILTGKNMALLTDDNQAPFKDKFSMVKEEVNSGPSGYYFRPNLPIKHELLRTLMIFRDTGIIQKIHSRTNWKLSFPWRELQRTKFENQAVVIGISHLLPLVILISVGFGQSFISMYFEIKISGMSKQSSKDIAYFNNFKKLFSNIISKYLSVICIEINERINNLKSNLKRSDKIIVLSEEVDCQRKHH